MEKIHERPSWIINYKKPIGTEIKYINGHWYLYERKSVWDSEKGRPKKKSGKLIGTLTETGIILKQEKSKHEALVCYEFGASYLIYKTSSNVKDDLVNHYEKFGLLLYCISSLMLKENIRLINIAESYKESYLKILEGRLSFTLELIKSSLNKVANDDYFKNNFYELSFDEFTQSFEKDKVFYLNKKYLELDEDETLLPLYYIMEIIKKSIDSYMVKQGINKDTLEIIELFKTYHVFRENRKYIKAKPLKSVEKLIEKMDLSFEIK